MPALAKPSEDCTALGKHLSLARRLLCRSLLSQASVLTLSLLGLQPH